MIGAEADTGLLGDSTGAIGFSEALTDVVVEVEGNLLEETAAATDFVGVLTAFVPGSTSNKCFSLLPGSSLPKTIYITEQASILTAENNLW